MGRTRNILKKLHFGVLGLCGVLVMWLCAYCVAWASAIVSISSDVSLLWIAVPPIASVIVGWWCCVVG